MVKVFKGYLSKLYRTTMDTAYNYAWESAAETLKPGATILDCGASRGGNYFALKDRAGIPTEAYTGIEWSLPEVKEAQSKGLNVVQGDLNRPTPFPNDSFDCVLALSVLEHLLNGCAWINDTLRILKPGGKLVLLTPNIATYFTALTVLRGKMPTTGPHLDSNIMQQRHGFDMNKKVGIAAEGDTPTHRHLVVFSYAQLQEYLNVAGFRDIEGRAFGHYPAPLFMQPMLQKLDPWHCHQMVFTTHK